MRARRFESAWKISDRVLRSELPPDPNAPLHLRRVWDGSPLVGRSVLVRCHHGLGDTIQFARYLPRLVPIVRRLMVWAPLALHPLLQSTCQSAQLLPLEHGEPDEPRDVEIEIMELPHAFRTTLDTIPRDIPYIHAPSSDEGRPRATVDRTFRVGIAWRAGNWNPRRSMTSNSVRRLTRIPDATFYSLHREQSAEEQEAGLRYDEECQTLVGTARFMRTLDLVVSVDSMPAHLAGALGIPTWTILPTTPDWRWMLNRSDSPWYPTMRLFRQSASGKWDSVVDSLAVELTAAITSRRGPRAA